MRFYEISLFIAAPRASRVAAFRRGYNGTCNGSNDRKRSVTALSANPLAPGIEKLKL